MGNCKIENCENVCGESSRHICDICYDKFLAGEISFREYSRLNNRAYNYVFNFESKPKSIIGYLTKLFILFAGLCFFVVSISLVIQFLGWILPDSIVDSVVAWYQSEAHQDFLNLDSSEQLTVLMLRFCQFGFPIMVIWALLASIYEATLRDILQAIIIVPGLFVAWLIWRDISLPTNPTITTAFAAVIKNILLPISFDFMTVLPEPGLSILSSYKTHLIKIK